MHVKYKIIEWFNVTSKHTPSYNVYQNLCNQPQCRIAVEPNQLNQTEQQKTIQTQSNSKLVWLFCDLFANQTQSHRYQQV